jgi:phosphodiesterase/alkaline phosphatase D-like protein
MNMPIRPRPERGLRLIVLSMVGLIATGGPALGAAPEDPPKEPPLTITHGPILGRPGSRSMGVWARTSRPGSFVVRYGAASGPLDQASAPVATGAGHDCTGWVLLERLKPDTRYALQVVPAGAPVGAKGAQGSFHTLPDADEVRDTEVNPRGLFNFKFEVGSCNDQRPANSYGRSLPAFGTMLREGVPDKVHFAILNGDWLYEEERDYSVDQWCRQVGVARDALPEIVRQEPAIVGVWQNYKAFLERGENLAAWHRRVPSYFTIDDHEILNDVIGSGQVGLRNRRAVFRDTALAGWYDYVGWSNPVPPGPGLRFGRARLKAGSDILVDDEADFSSVDPKQSAELHVHWGTPDEGVDGAELDMRGGDPNAGVYAIEEVLDRHRLRVRPPAKADGDSSYSIGRRSYYRVRVGNCDFFFLDTRSHRQRHDLKHADRAGISMLGTHQLDWLTREMKGSDADFLFVVSSVPVMIPHVDSGGMAFAAEDKDDSWTAFLDERERLIRFWDGLGKPVTILTGDLHNSFAIRVTGRVREFACGPHNSGNHPASAEAGRPASGPFNSRGRNCEIMWSTYFRDDVPKALRRRPVYCVIQVNNAFNNPLKPGEARWVAFPRPQVVVQYHDGVTGSLLYAESIPAAAPESGGRD